MKKMCVVLLGTLILLMTVPQLNPVSSQTYLQQDDVTGDLHLFPASPYASVKQNDTIPPTVTITSPQDGDTVSGIVTITGTANDTDGIVKWVYVAFDRGPWMAASGTTNWTFTWDTLSYNLTNSSHIISVKSNDGFHDSDVAQINVTVHNMPQNQFPTITISSPQNNSIISGIILVTGTAHDSDGTVHHVEVSIDRGPWYLANGTTTWHYTWDTREVTNGTHIIWAQSYDGTNYSTIAHITIIVNNIPRNNPPAINITSPPEGAIVTNVTIISGFSSDPDGDPLNITVQIDQNAWKPAGITIAPPYWSWSYTWDTKTVSDGNHTIRARAFDGTDFTIVSQTVVVANLPPNDPPSVSIIDPPDSSIRNGTVTIQGTSSDSDGLIEKIEVKINDGPWYLALGTDTWNYTWDTRTVPDGSHTIVARSYDGRDYSENAVITLHVDNTPPITTYSFSGLEGDGDWWRSTVIVTLGATDNVSGVADTFYKINDGAWNAYNGSFNMFDEGVFVIHYYSQDTLGQKESEHSFTLKIDQTVPVTNHTLTPDIPDGNNDWYKRSVTVTFSRNDSISWINQTRYRLNNETWMTYLEPFVVDVDGDHVITYYSIDNAGNIEENHTIQLKIDQTPPTISLTRPQANKLYIFDRETIRLPFQVRIIGKITLQATANDATSGIEKVQFIIDHGSRIDDSTAPFTHEYDEMALLIHRHIVLAKAFDEAGNTRVTNEIAVWIFNI